MKLTSYPTMLGTLKRTTALLFAVCMIPVKAIAAEIVVETKTGFLTNEIQFKRVEYVGQCPGEVITSVATKARFTSSAIQPAPGRRVIIRNVTKGMNNNPYPYTDREFKQGQYSQGFDFNLDTRHRGQTFSVVEGENQFEYEILEKKQVIEKGTFTVQVSISDRGTFSRDAICENKLQCVDETDCDKDKKTRQRCYTTTQCRCP